MNLIPISKTQAWQETLLNAITDPKELLELLELDMDLLTAAQQAAKLFPLKAPRQFIANIEKGNPDDPLLRQILPLGAELIATPGYTSDPLQEAKSNPLPGLLHKYNGRVLLTLTSVCSINCRYCFRRDFPYADNNPGTKGWEKVVAYIKADTSIKEIILSGGDPLMLNDHTLKQLMQRFIGIKHLKRLRIHTRLPIVLPERITPELILWLQTYPLQTILVTHCNHPNEISAAVSAAIAQLRAANIYLLNQAVLLKGVNDTADIQIKLSEKLFSIGIQPYYLHLLDKVTGSAHFDVNKAQACRIYAVMRQQLSGYLVPRLVYEEAGATAKTPVTHCELCTG
jgi:EF-P beta-lysylation protein EpmB